MKSKQAQTTQDINQTFEYSSLMKFIYRYGNIPTSLLMLVYLLPILFSYSGEFLQIFTIVLLLLILFSINYFFFKFYSSIPYKIITDETKMVVSNFLKNDRTEEIPYSAITKLNGGIFEGRISGLMKVHFADQKYFGFFQRIKNAKLLEAIILSKVDRKIYDEVLNNLIIPAPSKDEK